MAKREGPIDLTEWQATPEQFAQWMDQHFAKLARDTYREHHRRGAITVVIADQGGSARAHSYVTEDALFYDADADLTEWVQTYDPESQAVLLYLNEAATVVEVAKLVVIDEAQ